MNGRSLLSSTRGADFDYLGNIMGAALWILASGCAMRLEGLDGIDSPQVYSLDAVKLISPSISSANDPSTFGQPSYDLATDRRLLLRFESLGSHADLIRVDGGRKVELRIQVTSGLARDLSACPIVRNWMMLATWRRAHPVGGSGDWTRDGGDYDEAGCVAARGAVRVVGETSGAASPRLLWVD